MLLRDAIFSMGVAFLPWSGEEVTQKCMYGPQEWLFGGWRAGEPVVRCSIKRYGKFY